MKQLWADADYHALIEQQDMKGLDPISVRLAARTTYEFMNGRYPEETEDDAKRRKRRERKSRKAR